MPKQIEWSIFDDKFTLINQRDPETGNVVNDFSERDGSYSMYLPSLDFDMEIMDDVILRASYSMTVTRPNYNDLKGALLIDYVGKESGGGRRGNPQLMPMEAHNFDLSLEWYYNDASYISAGYWEKRVDNFIISRTYRKQPLFPDLYTPYEGKLHLDAVDELTGGDPRFDIDNGDLNEYYIENYASAEYNEAVEIPEEDDPIAVQTGLEGDPVALFDITIPINQDETEVKGLELMAQHTFGESGFGFQANYTVVDGDLKYDINLNEEQWVVPGMSDTANLVGFYDKDGFQIRLAYNWRDEYLQSPARDPRFVEEYSQLDINASYEFSDNFSVFIEGINLTEEHQRIHGRSKYQVREYSVGHARYNLGAKYSF
jgi:TonB-dependent receptor